MSRGPWIRVVVPQDVIELAAAALPERGVRAIAQRFGHPYHIVLQRAKKLAAEEKAKKAVADAQVRLVACLSLKDDGTPFIKPLTVAQLMGGRA